MGRHIIRSLLDNLFDFRFWFLISDSVSFFLRRLILWRLLVCEGCKGRKGRQVERGDSISISTLFRTSTLIAVNLFPLVKASKKRVFSIHVRYNPELGLAVQWEYDS